MKTWVQTHLRPISDGSGAHVTRTHAIHTHAGHMCWKKRVCLETRSLQEHAVSAALVPPATENRQPEIRLLTQAREHEIQ